MATGSAAERQTRDPLLALLARYDLRRWQVTDAGRIAQGEVPLIRGRLFNRLAPYRNG